MTHDVIQRLEAYGEYAEAVAPAISVDELDLRSAGRITTRTPQRRAFPNWAVAVGAAVAVFILIGGVVWLIGGTGSDVIDEPSTSTTTTLSPNVPAGTWNPILSTTIAREAPAAATCPEGTNPDAPGPVDQIRPGTEGAGVVTAVFDRHAGRIVYVNHTRQTWTFDVCTNTWQQVHPTGTTPNYSFGGLVYDIDSDVTVALGPEGVSVYDADTNTWTHPPNDRLGYDTDHIIPYGSAYDPVTGLIITSNRRRPSDTRINAPISLEFWAYDVDTNKWTLLGPLRREPSHKDSLELLGYSEQLDQLIITGGVDGEEGTVLVDPRTGDVTILPIDSPGIDIGWPNGTYGAAGGTVYAATRSMANPNDICGFDANVKSWTACFDTPTDANIGGPYFPALVGDRANNRLILINAGPRYGTTLNNVGAIDLDTGQWTQILAPPTP